MYLCKIKGYNLSWHIQNMEKNNAFVDIVGCITQHYFGKTQTSVRVLQTDLLEGAMVRPAVCWEAWAVSAGFYSSLKL